MGKDRSGQGPALGLQRLSEDPHFHGRRRGRRLRVARSRALESGLARFAIAAGEGPLDPATLFGRPIDALWLEIGFGGGEHLAWQARENPGVGLIGCEPFIDGVASLLVAVEAAGLDNVRVLPDDVRGLLPRLPAASVARAFILFPDPWPKTRHHKRRIIQPGFLDALARVLAPGAELRVGTDDPDYLTHILCCLAARADFRWRARAARDWTERPADWPQTRYEAKAIAAGRPCTFLRYVFNA